MFNGTGFFHRLTDLKLSRWQRYLAATALIALATFLRLQLDEQLSGYPYLLYFPMIILCGLLLEGGTAIYALVLSAILTVYFFIEPRHSLEIQNRSDAFGLFLFLAAGVAIALITESMRALVDQLKTSLTTLASTNLELKRTIYERDILLRELEHRTKNDFQVAASLLRLESSELAGEEARSALIAAADRIAVVARVHGHFTHRSDFSRVDLHTFLNDVIADFRSAHLGSRPIAIELAAERIEATAQLAIYLGLIANELLTNALKYAFPDARAGHICVTLAQDEKEDLKLVVSDNGVGSANATSGTGTRLIHSLVQLLGGAMEEIPGKGTTTRVCVPHSAIADEAG